MDTVFPVETPLEVRREEGSLVGPGVGDNAAAVATAVAVVEELLASEPLAPGAVAFTVGEEGLGNLSGAISVCEELRPEAFIALEGHGLDCVVVDAVGSVRARVAFRGPGGHSWFDRGRPSAVHGLLELGAALLSRDRGDAAINVGVVRGGRSVNAIADEAELLVELRALDEELLDRFVAEIEAVEVPPPLVASVDVLARRQPGRLRRDAPLLATVRAVRAGLGLPDELDAGSTDANAALARGIPALSLGVARGSGMHTLGERIDLASLELGRHQLRAILRQWLG